MSKADTKPTPTKADTACRAWPKDRHGIFPVDPLPDKNANTQHDQTVHNACRELRHTTWHPGTQLPPLPGLLLILDLRVAREFLFDLLGHLCNNICDIVRRLRRLLRRHPRLAASGKGVYYFPAASPLTQNDYFWRLPGPRTGMSLAHGPSSPGACPLALKGGCGGGGGARRHRRRHRDRQRNCHDR